MTGFPFRYDPSHAALVVVDVQNDFCDPAGALARLGSDVSDAAAMAPRLRRLIAAAHDAGVPVVFVRTTHDVSDDTDAWLSRFTLDPAQAPAPTICRIGTWGAEFFVVGPGPADTVVTKHRYSAFAGTSLPIVLRTLGARSLLFTGVSTEVCVESSLRDGLASDYFVSLVEDCAASYDREAHEAAAKNIARNFGTVTTSAELMALWAADTAPAPTGC